MTGIVIVADPDERSRRHVAAALREGGYEVAIAHGDKHVAFLLGRRVITALVIDPGDVDPVQVLADLRTRTDLPVIVVSDRTDEFDKVALLNAGADDYVCKPVGVEELLARLRSVLRRTYRSDTYVETIVTDDFTIDLDERRLVRADGTEVNVTPTEWRLIEVMVRHPGHLVSQRDLLERVWGPAATTKTAYLRVHIANIRHKLEPHPTQPKYFITVPGLGHRFEPSGNGAGDIDGRYRSAGASSSSTTSAVTNRTPMPGSVRK